MVRSCRTKAYQINIDISAPSVHQRFLPLAVNILLKIRRKVVHAEAEDVDSNLGIRVHRNVEVISNSLHGVKTNKPTILSGDFKAHVRAISLRGRCGRPTW